MLPVLAKSEAFYLKPQGRLPHLSGALIEPVDQTEEADCLRVASAALHIHS